MNNGFWYYNYYIIITVIIITIITLQLIIITIIKLQLLKVIKVGIETLSSTGVTITINEDGQFTAHMVSECVTNKRFIVFLCISNIGGVCQC